MVSVDSILKCYIDIPFNCGSVHIRLIGVRIHVISDMNTNRLCLTLIDPDIHYDPVRVVRQQVNIVELGNDLGYIAECHCGAEYETEYETEYSESIDTQIVSSIDSN